MIIRLLSDLHLEYRKPIDYKSILRPGNVLVLAGDIGDPFANEYGNFLKTCKLEFDKVFLVPGNHEYYTPTNSNTSAESPKRTMRDVRDRMKDMCASCGITYLNFRAKEYENYTFIGTTLWSHIPEEKIPMARKYLGDFRKIPDLDPHIYNFMHDCSVMWLEGQIKLAKKKAIVVTHHLPSFRMNHQIYRGHKMECCFASNLDHMLDEKKIVAWLCGHSHMHMDVVVNGVRCVINPVGYTQEKTGYNGEWKCVA